MNKEFDNKMDQLLKEEGIVKKGDSMWFKAKLNAPPGTLYLTPKRLVFKKAGNQFAGFLVQLLVRSQRAHYVHNIELGRIKGMNKETFGLNRNILAITLTDGAVLKFGTTGYDEWKDAIESYIAELV